MLLRLGRCIGTLLLSEDDDKDKEEDSVENENCTVMCDVVKCDVVMQCGDV